MCTVHLVSVDEQCACRRAHRRHPPPKCGAPTAFISEHESVVRLVLDLVLQHLDGRALRRAPFAGRAWARSAASALDRYHDLQRCISEVSFKLSALIDRN